jgi:sugar phosphate isomerase/epimerase
MTRPLALEFISALGMPPDDMVALVADLGLGHMGLAPRPITRNADAYPSWDLLEDRALLARTRAAMNASGVALAIGEGFLIRPDMPVADHARALDLMAELGAKRVNAVNLGGNGRAATDAFASFAALATERGMRTTVEFLPMLAPGTYPAAIDFATQAGVEVLVDAMHFFRSGGRIGDLAAGAALIGHIQICDVPLPAKVEDYGREASQDRLPPGEGDLPLAAFIAALPPDASIGLELPMLSRAAATSDMRQLLAPAVAACRRLLDPA